MKKFYFILILNKILQRAFSTLDNHKNNNTIACDTWLKTHVINSTERHYFNLTTPLIKLDSFI